MKNNNFLGKLILIFFFFTFSHFAIAQNTGDYKSIGSGNWNTSSTWRIFNGTGWVAAGSYPGQNSGKYRVTVSAGTEVKVNQTVGLAIGDLYVEGSLYLIETLTINSYGNPIPNLIINNGAVKITKNESLILPAGANIYMNITDRDTQGLLDVGGCTGDTSIVIGSSKYTACQGSSGSAGNFNQINSSAASGISVANANAVKVCSGGSVQLIGSKIGSAAVSNVKWEMVSTPAGAIIPTVIGSGGTTVPVTVSSGVLNTVGNYIFRFSFSVGSATSADEITVTVDPSTKITAQPADATYCQGSVASNLSVGATGSGLAYQWYSNTANNSTGGTLIAGATSPTYKPSTAVSGTLYYYAVVTSDCQTVTSNVASIKINPFTTINAQPADATYCQDFVASSLSVGATGSGLAYQWYSNTANNNTGGTLIAGATSSTYNPSTATIGTLYYYAVITGSCGTVTSNTAQITVNQSPVVTVTSNSRICQGADAIFTITGTPGAQVTYTINGGSPLTVSLTGGDATVTVPSSSVDQNLKIIAVSKGSCTNSTEVSATVTVGAESVYANGVWSKGRPSDNGLNAVIAGNYNTADGNIKACNCTVQAGGVLTVSKGTVLKIENALVNNGTLTVESDGNIIQVNDAAVNSGNILVKRKLTFRSDDRKEYNYLISPVEDANLKTQMYRKADGTAVIAPFVLYHNEANDYFYNSSGAYIKGRALAVKEPTLSSGAIDTAFFHGKPFNGKIDYSLAFSAANRGFNLVGNPYPSNLDLNLLYWQNEKEIDPNIRLWDNSVNDIYVQQGSSYKGYAYALRNEVTGNAGVGVPATGRMGSDKGNSKAKMPDRIVNVGQGFMVKAAGAGKVLKYSNSLRSTEQGTVFFGKTAQDDRYWLQLKAPSGMVSTIAIVYFANGNSSFSIDDSRTMGGSDALYSFADNEKVAINGRTIFSVDDKINLGSSHFVKGDYTISIGDREGVFASGQKIYLKDVLTGTITNLSEGDYTFNANAGENTGRFEVIYKAETVLAVDSQSAGELMTYRDGGDFVVKAQSKKITGLELYDTAGRLIYKAHPNSLLVKINGEMLSSGMYILKADQNGIVTAKKIIK